MLLSVLCTVDFENVCPNRILRAHTLPKNIGVHTKKSDRHTYHPLPTTTMPNMPDKNIRQLIITAFLNGPVSNKTLATRAHLSEYTI